MTEQHLSELDQLARDIYDYAASKLTDYFLKEYGNRKRGSFDEQMEDFHLVAERASIYLMGNVLAIMNEATVEESIAVHNKHLRSMVQTIRSMSANTNGLPN